jgi:hypothetical protein
MKVECPIIVNFHYEFKSWRYHSGGYEEFWFLEYSAL